jgi:hypothetical protein
VLQEQSTLPLKNAKRMAENVTLFDEAISESGAKTVLYMTWARQSAPESQKAISDAYNSIGKQVGAIVVPVGTAWQKFATKHDEPMLYDRDQSHPSLAGTYFAACVFLIALLKLNPVGIVSDVEGLSDSDQKVLQTFAWKQCSPRRSDDRE